MESKRVSSARKVQILVKRGFLSLDKGLLMGASASPRNDQLESLNLGYRNYALLNHDSKIPTFHCSMEAAKAHCYQKTNDYDRLYKFGDVP